MHLWVLDQSGRVNPAPSVPVSRRQTFREWTGFFFERLPAPQTQLLLQRSPDKVGKQWEGWCRIRTSEAEGKGWSVIVGQWEYKYPEQEGETAMCHSPSSRCSSALLHLRFTAGRGERWRSVPLPTQGQRAHWLPQMQNTVMPGFPSSRLVRSCLFLHSFVTSFPFLQPYFPVWRRSRHFILCREICADAKLLFMFFYFERLPYLPTAKHHITQQLEIGLSFLYGHIFCTSSIGFLLTCWVFTQSTEVWHQLATHRHNMQITSAELAWMFSKIKNH